MPGKRPRSTSTRQWLLLVLAGIFVALGSLLVALTGEPRQHDWSELAVWIACASLGGLILDRFLPNRDALFFPLVMFLSGWGLVAIKRLAPPFADRQEIWLVISVLAMLFCAVFPYVLRWLSFYRYIIVALGLVLLLATIVVGSNPSGFAFAPRLWLRIGALYLQPSEMMKIVLVAFLASYLAEQSATLHADRLASNIWRLPPRLFGPMLLMWVLSVVILIWQRDLGTAMLFFIVFVLLLYVTSGDLRIIIGGLALVLAAGVIAYQLFAVVQLRVDIWLNPWAEAAGRAYQIVQSLMAFGAGGMFGTGVGLGSPHYIPVVHSDFVFAAVAEEWGLLGIVGILGSFAVLALRGLTISMAHPGRAFYRLLAFGMTMMLTVQAIMIMAGVLKLVPLTGVTLPFISYGGSSLLVSYIMIGIMIRLSSEAR